MFKLYIWSFFVALVISLIFTPLLLKLAEKFKVYGQPEKRDANFKPIVLWGGVSIFFAFVVSIGSLIIDNNFRALLSYQNNFIGQKLIGILIGAVIIIILGIINDKGRISAVSKLLTQIIAALMIVTYGIKISGIYLPFLKHFFEFPILISNFLTILWLIAFINAINRSDDSEGLAGGIVFIACLAFFIVNVLLVQNSATAITEKNLKLAAILCTTLGGAIFGFLYYNFYPAKILMGNSGTMFLGFMLGSITIIGILESRDAIMLFIPIIVTGLPFLNIVLPVLSRFKSKSMRLNSDKGYFYQQLSKKGSTQREILFKMYFISSLLGTISIGVVILKYIITK